MIQNIDFYITHLSPPLLPCNRCHLGDPERGGGRPPGRDAAALLLPGRVQHPAAPSAGRRLQPLRLAREEQVSQQQRASQRGAARSERTFTTQLCGSSRKQSTKQSINSLLQPGETINWAFPFVRKLLLFVWWKAKNTDLLPVCDWLTLSFSLLLVRPSFSVTGFLDLGSPYFTCL